MARNDEGKTGEVRREKDRELRYQGSEKRGR